MPGGEHRSQSVAAALEEVRTELVAIHDAARPLVTAELIDAEGLEQDETQTILPGFDQSVRRIVAVGSHEDDPRLRLG